MVSSLESSNILELLVHSGSIWPRRSDTQDLCSNREFIAIVLVSGSSDLRTVVAFDQSVGDCPCA